MKPANWLPPTGKYKNVLPTRAANAFLDFIKDTNPQVPGKGGFVSFTLEKVMINKIRQFLRVDKTGAFVYGTVALCWPRRHGKTLLIGIYHIWRLIAWRNQLITIVSNSENQTVGTAYRLVKQMLENTPYFRMLIDQGHIVVQAQKFSFEARNNEINALASEASTIVGRGVDDAQISEGFAMRDSSMYDASASSQGDRWNAQSVLDSVVSRKGHFYHNLYSLARTGKDPTIYFDHIEYQDLDDALVKTPGHISKTWLKSRAAQMPPLEFQMMHLNRWIDAAQQLFKLNDIENCYRPEIEAPIDNDMRETLEKEWDTTFEFGIGVDRKLPGIIGGDNTAVTVVGQYFDNVLKRQRYLIFNQWVFGYEDADKIKDCLRWVRRNHYWAPHVVFEVYQSGDIHQWAMFQEGYQSELFHATPKYQNIIFNTVFNTLQAHDLVIPAGLPVHPKMDDKDKPIKNVRLIKEMLDFEYDAGKGYIEDEQGGIKPKITYGHPAGRDMVTGEPYHDDTVYSLGWCLYSLRKDKAAENVFEDDEDRFNESWEHRASQIVEKHAKAKDFAGMWDPQVGEY